MLRFLFLSSCVAFTLLHSLGCGPPAHSSCHPAALFGAPERLVYGGTALASLSKSGSCEPEDATVASADPSVVTVERLSSRGVELYGAGVGSTMIIVEEYGERTEYSVEVADHERFEVLHVERSVCDNPVSSGSLEGKALLAFAEQNFVVAYFDSRGLLVGRGLAEVTMPVATGGVSCDLRTSCNFEARCWRPTTAAQSIRVAVDEEEQTVEVTGVAADDVVDLLLISTDEDDAQPGQTIRVDALGVTSDGTRVHGVHASAAERWLPVPFAYDYRPGAEPLPLVVSAVHLEQEFVFRGDLKSADGLRDRVE